MDVVHRICDRRDRVVDVGHGSVAQSALVTCLRGLTLRTTGPAATRWSPSRTLKNSVVDGNVEIAVGVHRH